MSFGAIVSYFAAPPAAHARCKPEPATNLKVTTAAASRARGRRESNPITRSHSSSTSVGCKCEANAVNSLRARRWAGTGAAAGVAAERFLSERRVAARGGGRPTCVGGTLAGGGREAAHQGNARERGGRPIAVRWWATVGSTSCGSFGRGRRQRRGPAVGLGQRRPGWRGQVAQSVAALLARVVGCHKLLVPPALHSSAVVPGPTDLQQVDKGAAQRRHRRRRRAPQRQRVQPRPVSGIQSGKGAVRRRRRWEHKRQRRGQGGEATEGGKPAGRVQTQPPATGLGAQPGLLRSPAFAWAR